MHGTDGLREFQAADVTAVRALIEHTIDISYAAVYPPRAVAFFKTFHSEAKILERHRQGKILVIERDGGLVATGALVGRDILGVFVDPRAQHRGHGKAMMRELEACALVRGLDEVEISASLPSRRFYESCGYGGFEDRERDLGEGQRLTFWKAWKTLTADAP